MDAHYQKTILSIVDICTEIVTLTKEVNRAVKSEANLSATQYRLLATLEVSRESVSEGTLARLISAPLSTTASALHALRHDGLVRLSKAPDDTRASMAAMTKKGAYALALADRAASAFLAHIWGRLDREQKTLLIWSSSLTLSARGLLRAHGGHLNIDFAYYEGSAISVRLISKALAAYGLSFDCFRVLASLAARIEGARASELGCALMLHSSEMTRLLRMLEEADLVEPKVDKADGRAIVRRATSEGHELVMECLPKIIEVERFGMVPLSQDEYEAFFELARCANEVLREGFTYR